MKITVQEKVAELERRIVALETLLGPKEQWQKLAAETRAQRIRTERTTTTTTTSPLTPEQQGHWDSMWTHFDGVFSALGKVFRGN